MATMKFSKKVDYPSERVSVSERYRPEFEINAEAGYIEGASNGAGCGPAYIRSQLGVNLVGRF